MGDIAPIRHSTMSRLPIGKRTRVTAYETNEADVRRSRAQALRAGGRGEKKSREGQRRSRAQRPRSDWRPTPPPFRQHPNHRAHATDKERLSSASRAIEKAATRGASSGTRQRVGIGWLVGRRATLR